MCKKDDKVISNACKMLQTADALISDERLKLKK
jgi:hypothetical protein